MYKLEEDGKTHINVYSKSKTELGRFLSNFSHSPIETEDGHFESIEGYWYWLSCKDDNLRKLYGWLAKDYGRKHQGVDWIEDSEFKRKIKEAIEKKIKSNEQMLTKLRNTNLPLTHYYVYGTKVIEVQNAQWILDIIENIRKV